MKRLYLVITTMLLVGFVLVVPAFGGDSAGVKLTSLIKRVTKLEKRVNTLAARKPARGPAGPSGLSGLAGPAGPEGPPGAAGPRGPSNVFTRVQQAGTIPLFMFAPLGTPSPATFVMHANLELTNNGAAQVTVVCTIESSSGALEDEGTVTLAPGETETASLTGADTFPATLTPGFFCKSPTLGANVAFKDANFILIQVGSVQQS
jgi:hypothetical protein